MTRWLSWNCGTFSQQWQPGLMAGQESGGSGHSWAWLSPPPDIPAVEVTAGDRAGHLINTEDWSQLWQLAPHLTSHREGRRINTDSSQLSSFNYCQLGCVIIWSDRDLTTTDCYEDKSYSWEILISRNARSDSGLGKGVRAEFAPLWGFTSCLYWSSSSPVSSSGQWCICSSMRARR